MIDGMEFKANGQSDSAFQFEASTVPAATPIAVGGFDAVKSTNRRRSPTSVLQSEDASADRSTRRKLISTTRDVRRNFSVARWAINKHLDFIVSHTFRSKTGDDGFDRELERFVKHASRKANFDSRSKHPRRRFMRLLEAGRTVDGDSHALKLRGGRLQGVEGDRIRDPDLGKRRKGEQWVHGVLLNRYGGDSKFCIHSRQKNRFKFERIVPVSRMISIGYYDRFDQTRGVSPLASAVRDYRDVYDGFDYALAREKVNQFFAMVIKRDAPEMLPGDKTTAKEPYQINFGGGPVVLDLDPGDDANFLNSQGTSDQSQKFWDTTIAMALKSLDIPFSFFREDFTNFFGSRAALMLYLKSCKEKREDVVEFSDEWLRWRILEGELNGELTLPSGFDVNECDQWEWLPAGVPWWNPSQEVKANVQAVDNYQRSRGEIRAEQYGDDWFDMMDRRRKEDEYLKSYDLPLSQPTNAIEITTEQGAE